VVHFILPSRPPRDGAGFDCHLCTNECLIPEGGRGYCGLRINRGNRLVGATAERGNVSWYYDHLPTNCVADWVCASGTGAGYPILPICSAPNMATRTWQSSISPVPLIVSSARTGTFATRQRGRAMSVLWDWLRRSMSRLPASATSVAIPPPSYPMLFAPLGWLWRRIEAGFSASAGKLIAQCPLH